MPPGNESIEPLRHQAVVEEILGVPLLPQGVVYELQQTDVPDIRARGHNIVVHAVQNTLHKKLPTEPDGSGRYLSERHVEHVREQAAPVIQEVRRRIIIANHIAESVDRPLFRPPQADAPTTPRAMLQSRIGQALFSFSQAPHPPRLNHAPTGPLAPLCGALLIGSPTATGKTAPLAEFAQRGGVGKVFHPELDPEQHRMLLVVPSIELLEETMDPDGTIRQWLPDVEFSAYYTKAKDADGVVSVVVDESLPKAVRAGAIDLARYTTRAVDEAHHVGAPQMNKLLGELSSGQLVLMTATPNRVRRFFNNYTATTPRDAAEQGITRPVELLTYTYRPDIVKGRDLGAEKLVTTLARRLIADGKKVGIYCRVLRHYPDAQQARDIAEMINKDPIQLPDGVPGTPGDYVRVIAQASGEQANRDAEAAFKAGDIRAYCAVGKMAEGRNIEMDVAFIIGPRWAQDKWTQIAGRIPRVLMGHPELAESPGTIIDIQPAEVPENTPPLASTWRTYGFTEGDWVMQGMYIGPDGEEPTPPPREANPRGEGVVPGVDDVIDPDAPSAETDQQDGNSAEDILRKSAQRPHSHVQSILAELGVEDFSTTPVLLRSVTIAPKDWERSLPPEPGSKALSALAAKYNVPEMWLRRQLDALAATRDDITYVGVRSAGATEEGVPEFERHYGPATEAYLDANPPVGLSGSLEMSISDIAELAGVPRQFIERMIENIEAADKRPLPAVSRMGKTHRPTRHFATEEVNRIIGEVEKTPIATENEVALADLGAETNNNHVYNYVRAQKNNVIVHERRRRPEDPVNGYARHVDAETAQRIRDAWYNPPLATKNDMSLAEIARRAEMNLKSVISYVAAMDPEQRPETYGRKHGPKGIYAEHMERARGMEVVEALRVQKLPPNRITLGLLAQYFDSDRKTITVRIATLARRGLLDPQEARYDSIKLGGQGRQAASWGWHVMEVLEQEGGMSLRAGVERVDYTRVARGQYDPNWGYSQEVQRRFVRADRLAALPGQQHLQRMAAAEAEQVSVEAGEYARQRNARFSDILTAVATQAIAGSRLIMVDTADPSNPQYRIPNDLLPGFNVYFDPEMGTPAPPANRSRKAKQTPAAEPPQPMEPEVAVVITHAAPMEMPDAVTPLFQERAAEPAAKTPLAEAAATEPTTQPAAKVPAPTDAPAAGLSFEEIMAHTGRNPEAVRNMLNQLGFGDDFVGGNLPGDKATLVVRALTGGKQARKTAAESSAPPAASSDQAAKPARAEESRPRTSITDLAELFERRPGGIVAAIRQLGLLDHIVADTFPDDYIDYLADAFDMLDRGERITPRQLTAKTAGKQQSAEAKESPSTRNQPSTSSPPPAPVQQEDNDPTHWRNVEDVLTALKCTRAALDRLMQADRSSGPRLRSLDSGELQVHVEFVSHLTMRARRSRLSQDDWIKHGNLARIAGVPPQDLTAWLAKNGVNVNPNDNEVRRYPGQAVEYELTYNARVQKAVLRALDRIKRSTR